MTAVRALLVVIVCVTVGVAAYLAVPGRHGSVSDTRVRGDAPTARSLPAAAAVAADDVRPAEQVPRLPDPEPPAVAEGREEAVGTMGEAAALEDLRSRELMLPVADADRSALVQSFHEPRGARVHEAIDILAPRHTPVVAVEDGRIARLFVSERGGLTIYQFDSTERYCYYYAHLESYAPGLEEGMEVVQGQQIGTVGTSGNAPQDTPHLHFAIFELGPERRWWEGRPLDPYLVLR